MSTDSGSSVELQGLLLMMMSDSDMATAAQQLMQLSDEDNSSRSSSSSSTNSDGNNNQSEGWFAQSRCDITSAMIEEIFGKEEISRPTKKRKYRFLESIYKETKPMKVNYGNDLRYSTKP